MDENEEVAQTETEQTEEAESAETADVQEEDSTDYKALAEQKEQAFQDQKKRAEKAERALKDASKSPSKPKDDDLSSKDILALSTSGISDEEDIELLQRAAKLNGTSIAAAIKDPVVAGLLKGKQEERRTASATVTTGTRRTSTERKGSDILANATASNMPASGKDTRKMVRASLGLPD